MHSISFISGMYISLFGELGGQNGEDSNTVKFESGRCIEIEIIFMLIDFDSALNFFYIERFVLKTVHVVRFRSLCLENSMDKKDRIVIQSDSNLSDAFKLESFSS